MSTACLVNPPYIAKPQPKHTAELRTIGWSRRFDYLPSGRNAVRSDRPIRRRGPAEPTRRRAKLEAATYLAPSPTEIRDPIKDYLNSPSSLSAAVAVKPIAVTSSRAQESARVRVSVAVRSVFGFVLFCIISGLLFQRQLIAGDVALVTLVITFFFWLMTTSTSGGATTG
jgi:hypothetical protein